MILKSTGFNSFAENMKYHLENKVIGQNDAINQIVTAAQKWSAGLNPANRPICSFLFNGPTGTGKTHLVEEFFWYIARIGTSPPTFPDNTAKILKINCGEYQSSHEIAKIIGAPPGYLGHNETRAVFAKEKIEKHKPNVILFDEIEKASDAFFDLLLGILDRADLHLGNGTQVDFSNCYIFMTSNAGMDTLKKEENKIGFTRNATLNFDERSKYVESHLKKFFAPEFLNRVDKIVHFETLTKADVCQILELEMTDVQDRLFSAGHKVYVSLTDRAKNYLLDKGYSAEYGARNLKRVIETDIVFPLSNILTTYSFSDSNIISVSVDNDVLSFKKIMTKKVKSY